MENMTVGQLDTNPRTSPGNPTEDPLSLVSGTLLRDT